MEMYLHFIMLLLKRLYFDNIVDQKHTFTFHYASIKTDMGNNIGFVDLNLHFIMLLLKRYISSIKT